MLFTCGERGNATPGRQAMIKRSGKNFAIDVHCHVYTPAADDLVKEAYIGKNDPDPLTHFASERSRNYNRQQRKKLLGHLTSVEKRVAEMDRMGIDVQAVSTAPFQFYYSVEPDLCRKTARLVNESLAEIVASRPDRFVALGTVPMQEPALAVAELVYCVEKLGFRGLEIGTNVAGVDLSDTRFDRVFARAEELGAVIFLHPHGFTEARRFADHYLTNVVGHPLDTTLALSHLIFGGVLDRYPRLKIISAHGGGYLSHYPGRTDFAYKVRPECRDHIKRPPSSYLKKVYFDTVVFSHAQLEYLVKVWGAHRLVMGTDYPFDMGDHMPIDFLNGAKYLTRAEKDLIIGRNAARLLKIRLPAGRARRRKAKSRKRAPPWERASGSTSTHFNREDQ